MQDMGGGRASSIAWVVVIQYLMLALGQAKMFIYKYTRCKAVF